jgi:hypothetical protein
MASFDGSIIDEAQRTNRHQVSLSSWAVKPSMILPPGRPRPRPSIKQMVATLCSKGAAHAAWLLKPREGLEGVALVDVEQIQMQAAADAGEEL